MSSEQRRQAARERLAQQRERERHRTRQRSRRRAFAVLGVVVLGFGLLVGLKVAGVGSKKASAPTGSLDRAVLARVTGVPASDLATVGGGTGKKMLRVLPGPDLVQDGKPKLVYIGAEYCPYCAAERWALVVALSRFGTWSGLSATHSASDDVYPNTATFSFHGATFTSDHLVFEGVETNTNQKVGATYGTLETLTAEQQQLLRTFDAPPYVPAQYVGVIPFLDLGNRFFMVGSSYSPDLLAGRSLDAVSRQVAQPKTQIGQAVLGSANYLTAAVCQLTHDQPASVCTADPIPALKAQLPHA